MTQNDNSDNFRRPGAYRYLFRLFQSQWLRKQTGNANTTPIFPKCHKVRFYDDF